MQSNILQQIDSDLILRRATPADADRLSEFNARIHGDNPEDASRVAVTMRDLLAGRNPVFPPEDFTIVEDTRAGKIISSMCLFSQVWSYGGILFPAGQPEFVGTDPAYRNRKLVRLQFDVVHEWSAQRGQMLQGITGIPNFYRQYGYEMVADLDAYVEGYAPQVPVLPEGQTDPFRFRAPLLRDLDFIRSCYQNGDERWLLSMERSPEEMYYEVFGKSPENVVRLEFVVIEHEATGEPVGILAYQPFVQKGRVNAGVYELRPGVSWLEVTPSVLRFLWKTGLEMASRQGSGLTTFRFTLPEGHPLRKVMPRRLPHQPIAYAWYIRIPDLKAFLHKITPVLEQRLQNSPCAGHNGQLTVGFFRGQGLRFTFEHGRIARIEDYCHSPVDWPNAYFAGLTFYQLLLGYRSLTELEYAYPDCAANSDEGQALLPALFPKQGSWVWPLM